MRLAAIEARRALIDREVDRLKRRRLDGITLFQRLCRPETTYADLLGLDGEAVTDPRVARQIEVAAKYDGYVRRMLVEVERFRKMEERVIPAALDYHAVPGLSTEIRERLSAVRPRSLGQASRVPGVTPAAMSVLAVWCHRAHAVGAAPGSATHDSTP
jgi:tRNA uridine 5-carboxymethylaminomethyl modification enzyme